ncbi:MAG: hypothetical protein AAFN70_12120, partial [Planctomycetota bacterium]
AFDRESLRENRKLLVELPIAVVIGTVALYALGGVLAIATVYLYWQWFHYMRQSYGIERAYRFKGRAAGANDVGDLNGYVIYATAIAAILWRSSTGAELFIGMPVFMVPVPTFVAASALIIAGCMFSWWFVRTAGLVIRGEASPEHFVFTLSHCVVFFMAYVYIENITHGWLVINIWHNAQYLLFVWFANNKKFGGKFGSNRPVISTLSQPQNIWMYLVVCLLLTFVIYGVLHKFSYVLMTATALPLLLVTTMAINFHHYIVDSLIWKRKKGRKPQSAATGETAQA